MSYELPETDEEVISVVRQEYEGLQQTGGGELKDASFRLAWSLVHSSKLADVSLGLGMSQELLKDETDDQYRRDAMYYIAVGRYKSGHYVAARRQIMAVLEEWPEFRQGCQLKGLADDKVTREGLIGVAIAGATIVGAGAFALAASLLRR